MEGGMRLGRYGPVELVVSSVEDVGGAGGGGGGGGWGGRRSGVRKMSEEDVVKGVEVGERARARERERKRGERERRERKKEREWERDREVGRERDMLKRVNRPPKACKQTCYCMQKRAS